MAECFPSERERRDERLPLRTTASELEMWVNAAADDSFDSVSDWAKLILFRAARKQPMPYQEDGSCAIEGITDRLVSRMNEVLIRELSGLSVIRTKRKAPQ